MIKSLPFFLLVLILAVSFSLGIAAPLGAVEIDGVEYVEFTITAEQLYAMFESGDIQVVFGASSFYDMGENTTEVELLDGALSRVRRATNGSLLTQSATVSVSHSQDGIEYAYFYAPYLFKFSDYDISSDDEETEIYDSGDYSINIVLPFEGVYTGSSIITKFFGWREYTSSVVFDSDAYLSWQLFNDSVSVARAGTIFTEVPNTTWSSDWGLNWFYDDVITNTSSIPRTSNISSFVCEIAPNSSSELCNKFQIDINAYKYLTVENIAYIPLIFGMDSFTILVPDVPVDPDDPDVPVDPDDPDVPVDPDDPENPTYADMVGEYLDSITNPTPEGQAKADELKDKLDAAAEDLEQMGNDLSVEIPDISDNVQKLPDEALSGMGVLGQNFLFAILNQPVVIVIFSMLFVLMAIKLILYGSGAS